MEGRLLSVQTSLHLMNGTLANYLPNKSRKLFVKSYINSLVNLDTLLIKQITCQQFPIKTNQSNSKSNQVGANKFVAHQ